MNPESLSARCDETGVPEVPQMARHGRLRRAKALPNLAHAEVSASQQGQNSEARGVRKRRQ